MQSPETASVHSKPRSEWVLAETWDRAIENGIRYAAYGLVAGAATGLLLFRGGSARASVAGLGTGVGLGMAYADARREFRDVSARSTSSAKPTTSADESKE